MTVKLLIVENDHTFRAHLTLLLRQAAFEVFESDREGDAMALLQVQVIDVAVLSLTGLRREGLSLLKFIKKNHPRIEVITITDSNQVDLSIEGMKLGAFADFLVPFELDLLIGSIRDAYRKKPKP
jgi:DNA-binding NtrC family response regulator